MLRAELMNHKFHNIIGVVGGSYLSLRLRRTQPVKGRACKAHEMPGPRINQRTEEQSVLVTLPIPFAFIGFMKPIGILACYLLPELQPCGPTPPTRCLVDRADHPERS
jgi:hypothetical protein